MSDISGRAIVMTSMYFSGQLLWAALVGQYSNSLGDALALLLASLPLIIWILAIEFTPLGAVYNKR